MKLTFNQSTRTTISNKDIDISPDGGTTFITCNEGHGGVSNGDGGSLGIKPAV